MNKFLEFLYDSESIDTAEVRRDLEACGVDVARMQRGVEEILTRADKMLAHAWVERAKAKQARFEDQANRRAAELQSRYQNSRELMDAMLAGRMGNRLQERASVFFRNKNDNPTEEDLQSFLEDCSLLDLL